MSFFKCWWEGIKVVLMVIGFMLAYMAFCLGIAAFVTLTPLPLIVSIPIVVIFLILLFGAFAGRVLCKY